MALQTREPGGAPGFQFRHEPAPPWLRLGGLESGFLRREPARGIAQRLRVPVQAPDQVAHRLVPIAARGLDEALNGRLRRLVGIIDRLQHFIQRAARQRVRLFIGHDRQLRVQAQFVEMLADQFKAEAVQRANMGRFQQRQLFRQTGRGRLGAFEGVSQALAHFGGGGLGERHHQNLIHAALDLFIQQPGQATLHQRAGLARAGPGHDQDVPSRGDGFLLLCGECGQVQGGHKIRPSRKEIPATSVIRAVLN